MKRALVLSGGGVYGAFEVGAIDYLIHKLKLDFQIFFGSSVGTLNAAILSQSNNYQELCIETALLKKLWLEIKGNQSIYRHNSLLLLGFFIHQAFYFPDGLKKIIQKYIDPKRLTNSKKTLKFPTVALETGELFYVDNHTCLQATLLQYILASTSIPWIFPPVFINNKHWYDGGLRDITPLGGVFDEKPDEIFIILTNPINEKLQPTLQVYKYAGLIQNFIQLIEIISNEIINTDLQLALIINQLKQFFPDSRSVPIYLITPKKNLTGNILDFKPEKIKEYFELGYQAAASPRLAESTLVKQIQTQKKI